MLLKGQCPRCIAGVLILEDAGRSLEALNCLQCGYTKYTYGLTHEQIREDFIPVMGQGNGVRFRKPSHGQGEKRINLNGPRERKRKTVTTGIGDRNISPFIRGIARGNLTKV